MSDTEPGTPAQNPPAAWYPDPGAPPGRTGQRWWGGTAWTDHVVANPVPGHTQDTTTPDGVRLAGWGRRFGAYAIDGIIWSIVTYAVGFSLLRTMIAEAVSYVEHSVDAASSGGRPPGQFDFYAALLPEVVELSVISLVVVTLYEGLFLRVLSATPGKLMLGIRVRCREAPGRLPWSVIARRLVTGRVGVAAVSIIPFVGTLGGIYAIVDGLWALRDDHRQTLHDKFAGTNVVRVR